MLSARLSLIIALAHCFVTDSFSPSHIVTKKLGHRHSTFLNAIQLKERTMESVTSEAETVGFTPLHATTDSSEVTDDLLLRRCLDNTAAFVTGLTLFAESSNAITMPKELTLSSGSFDPSTFVPVCGASDTFYRFLQGSAKTIVGPENFVEYGPLIASGLLRVRLELCVVESFFNEAVGPFIQQNGLSWVLPLHETVETFLAGTVFALATTFILVGSTKILTVIFTYADFLIGAPLRLFGGFAFDRARGKPVTLDIGFGPFKTRVIGPKDVVGDKADDWTVDITDTAPTNLAVIVVSGGAKAMGSAIKLLRDILDAIDLFVGKSLILWVTAYVGFKFLHFKVFPDFPPF